MKKRFSLFIAIFLCAASVLITGCDDTPQTPYIPNSGSVTHNDPINPSKTPMPFDATETTEPEDDRAIPFSKMKEDMSAREEIQNFYTSDFVTESAYVVTDIELEKEQVSSDGKQTTSYSNIIAQNEYFEASLRVRSVYNFYDYGGWIMDEFSIEQLNTVTPLRVPDEDAIIADIKDDSRIYTYDDRNNASDQFILHEASITVESSELTGHTARFDLLVENQVMKLNCYAQVDHTEEGWSTIKCYTKSVQYDYSMALGSFTGEMTISGFGKYHGNGKGSIRVISITDNKAVIDVDYCHFVYSAAECNLMQGNNIECEFHPETGLISTPDDCFLEYDPITDSWRFYNFLTLNRSGD